MIVIIAVALVILSALCYVTFTGAVGGRADANPDPLSLVRGQLANNHGDAIADIGYDTALTFETVGPYISSVDPRSLSPLSNNFLARSGQSPDSPAVLIDETAVGRIISMNSDWVAYLSGQGDDVFSDVEPGSRAELFVKAYDGYQIIFHRLAFGQIYTAGQDVYVLTQPYYTIAQSGKTLGVNDVFLYKLTRQGTTLVISDIDQIKVPVSVLPNSVTAQDATDGQASEAQTTGTQSTDAAQAIDGQATEGQAIEGDETEEETAEGQPASEAPPESEGTEGLP